jgi:replicative DNA helicase
MGETMIQQWATQQREPLRMHNAVPPHDLDAEQAVLGAILIDNQGMHDVASLHPAMFYKEAHRILFTAFINLHQVNSCIDTLTVAAELRKHGKLDDVGGLPYLIGLGDTVSTTIFVEHYAKIVIEKAQYRDLIAEAQRIQAMAFSEAEPPEIIAAQSSLAIADIGAVSDETPTIDGSMAAHGAVERLAALMDGKRPIAISTGYRDLDGVLGGGLKDGTLNILAAPPSMGKSAFALAIGENVAKKGKGVLVFSIEMSEDQITDRRIAGESHVPLKVILSGQATEAQYQSVVSAAERIAQRPLFIQAPSEISVSELRAKAARFAREHPLSLVIIDYLQLITADSNRGDFGNEAQKLDMISRMLKAMARELRVPVLLLSQVARRYEERADSKPKMSDLRGSGGIEANADTVIFLHRDDYQSAAGKMSNLQVIVRKNRMGPVGEIDMKILLETLTPVEVANGQQYGY